MRKKVLAIAAEHEYEPRSSARSLANGKSFQLGIILCKLESDLSSPNLALFMSEFCREAMRHGYQVILLPIEDGEFDNEVVKNIRSSKADGYFIGANLLGMQSLEELTKRKIPVATYISDSSIPSGLDNVTFLHTDDDPGYEEMFKVIKIRGFNEMAIFCPESTAELPRMQLEAFCLKHNIELSEKLIFPASCAHTVSWREGFEAGELLLEQIIKHKLIFCFSDLLALGLCKALRQHGIEPGKDISVVAYDNIEENPNYFSSEQPFMATIDKNDRLAGKMMVKALLDDIKNPPRSRKNQVVNIATKFIVRDSLGWNK
jgi:LacI family transcriptional regulator